MVTSKTKRHNEFVSGLLAGGIVALLLFFLVDANSAEVDDVASSADVVIEQDAIDFTMGTRLGTGQVQETIEVFINDELVGTLNINAANPVDTLELEVDAEGIHEYRINSVTWMTGPDGRVYNYTGNGTGTIDVQEGDHFSAYYNNSTAIWRMMFIEE